MHLSLENFPKVYLINLERSADRRHFMVGQLQHYGIDFEVFNAVDGRQLTAEQLNLYSADGSLFTNARTLSKSEIGCALSHIGVYQRFIESGKQECIIFEDDVVFGTEFLNVIKCRDQFPKDWEFINFFTDTPERPFGRHIYRKYRMTRFGAWPNMAAAQLLRRSAALKLLDVAFPIRITADGLTGRTYRTGIKAYGIHPRVVTLRDFGSSQNFDALEFRKSWLFRVVKKCPRSLYRVLYKLGLTG